MSHEIFLKYYKSELHKLTAELAFGKKQQHYNVKIPLRFYYLFGV